MTNPQTEARAIARYEVFADPSYYDLWAVRPVGEQSFNATIHAASHADAEAIAAALAAKDAELAAERAALRLAADRADRAEAALAEARKALRGLLDCPDIADNDYKDEETHAAERAAHRALTGGQEDG